ncbi:MAG: hypothetical protein BWY09_01284 [Candidatus Hydrogenedentes bacterium ADurb.Bin179]|nr:MAG: hypothetical protein BWY09_01284 [Candidatus Hydrogenedentes bacterium ADurb.Bin179]
MAAMISRFGSAPPLGSRTGMRPKGLQRKTRIRWAIERSSVPTSTNMFRNHHRGPVLRLIQSPTSCEAAS